MATWFIRLGASDTKERFNTERYRDLANPQKHSLVMIGFAIDSDFSQLRNEIQIRSKLKTCLQRKNFSFTDGELDSRARLIYKFINEVKNGDEIISPFGEKSSKLKIGKIVGVCKAVNSFLTQAQITAFNAQHPSAKYPQDIEFKPAREVKWKNGYINNFSAYTTSEPGDLKQTIHLLR